MPGIESRDFSAPDETRTPDKTVVELVNIAGGQIGHYTFQPGWRWPECIDHVAPGHDAWNNCDEPAVFVEFQGAAHYAQSR